MESFMIFFFFSAGGRSIFTCLLEDEENLAQISLSSYWNDQCAWGRIVDSNINPSALGNYLLIYFVEQKHSVMRTQILYFNTCYLEGK